MSFLQEPGRARFSALRTAYFPVTMSQLPMTARLCKQEAMRLAGVLPLAINSLGGSNDHLSRPLAALDQHLIEQGRTHGIHQQELREIQHIVLIRSLVRHDIHALESPFPGGAVGDAAMDEFDIPGNVLWQ